MRVLNFVVAVAAHVRAQRPAPLVIPPAGFRGSQAYGRVDTVVLEAKEEGWDTWALQKIVSDLQVHAAEPAGFSVGGAAYLVNTGYEAADGVVAARCVDPFGMRFPIDNAVAQRIGVPPEELFAKIAPWPCSLWRFDSRDGGLRIIATSPAGNGTAAAADAQTELCLTRQAAGRGLPARVVGSACEKSTATAVRRGRQVWKFGDGSTKAKAIGAIYVGGGPLEGVPMCLTAAPACRPLVDSAGALSPCRLQEAVERNGLWYNPASAQTFVALDRAKADADVGFSTKVASHAQVLDCDHLLRPTFARLDAERIEKARVARKASATPEILVPEDHLGLYNGPKRDISDIYSSVPTGYLSWLSESERRRGTKRYEAMHGALRVKSRTHNWDDANPPRKVFSSALYIVAAPPYEDQAARIKTLDDAANDRVVWMRDHPGEPPPPIPAPPAPVPGSVEEAYGPLLVQDRRAQGDFDADAFDKKYLQGFLKGLAVVQPHLADWGVVVHISPDLQWLSPIILGACKRIEIVVMESKSMRSLGMLWRWLPLDDPGRFDVVLSLDVDGFKSTTRRWPSVWARMFPAVSAFVDQGEETNPKKPLNALLRWKPGWIRAVRRNYNKVWNAKTPEEAKELECLSPVCHQYPMIQGNLVVGRPGRFTFSWSELMIAFSLHRVVFQNDKRLHPRALRRPNAFSLPVNREHTRAWGVDLWGYAFDELFLKSVVYYRVTTDGTGLLTGVPGWMKPNLSLLDGHLQSPNLRVNDLSQLRCNNVWYLDDVYVRMALRACSSLAHHCMRALRA